LLVILANALGLAGCQPKPGLEATAERGAVTRIVQPAVGEGLRICDPKGVPCWRATLGARVPAGSVLRTGADTSAQIKLSEGSELSLDHDTVLHLASGKTQPARLSQGSVALEIPLKGAARARIDVNDAFVELSAGKVALRAGSDFAA
jgi:ferric-dicitrate binding protein FerR (iron transport regulator)